MNTHGTLNLYFFQNVELEFYGCVKTYDLTYDLRLILTPGSIRIPTAF